MITWIFGSGRLEEWKSFLVSVLAVLVLDRLMMWMMLMLGVGMMGMG